MINYIAGSDLEHLSNPYRVVIDIEDAVAAKKLTQPAQHDKFLQRVRSARHADKLRVVLDLKKYSRAKSFQLPPNKHYGHRLVIDLTGDEDEEEHKEGKEDDDDEEVVLREP